jgi:putative acetyltransferase
MNPEVEIIPHDPASSAAQKMLDALWDEIETRYRFSAPNGITPELFNDPLSGFWVAEAGNEPAGSIGLIPLSTDTAELEGMYVAPDHRGTGVAQKLVETFEAHARANGFKSICLRAGEPQPEALRFYEKMGFRRIANYGQWVGDPDAWCLGKEI